MGYRHWAEDDWTKSFMERQIKVWSAWNTKENIYEIQNKWKDAGGVCDAICMSTWYGKGKVWAFFGGGKVRDLYMTKEISNKDG